MSEFSFPSSNHCFGISKIDRSDESVSSSTVKVVTTTANTISKPELLIPYRGDMKLCN